jgi:predicted N-acetyltransferase YhbS
VSWTADKELLERQANFADLPRIVEIERSAFPPERWATEASLSERLTLFPAGTWLGLRDSYPVAFANGFPISDLQTQEDLDPPDRDLFQAHGTVWLLRNLAVQKEYQKQGFGKLLIQRQVALARQLGARHFRFTATVDLTSYYSALGFTQLRAPSMFHGLPQAVWNTVL